MYTTKLARRLLVVAGTAALLAGSAGCTDGATIDGGLALVIGARSNMPPPTLAGAALEAREAAVVSQSYLAVVVADGKPFQLSAGPLIARDANSVVQEQDRERNRRKIDEALTDAEARTAETDLLTALELGRRSIESAPGRHTMVVLDSGLSTAGALDFARHPDLLDADPEALVAGLKAAKSLPDLRGIRVVFQGLGDVVAPQAAVPLSTRKNLVAIWTAVARAAGAQDVRVEESPLTGRPVVALPDVTPVPMPDGPRCTVETRTLDDSQVSFVADSARLRDPTAARATLAPIAQKILGEGFAATLTGTTADVGDKDGQRRLSLQRAQAVQGLLADLGVPGDRLNSVGAGSDFPGYVPDHDGDGHLIPEAAAANRTVMVDLIGSGDAHCT